MCYVSLQICKKIAGTGAGTAEWCTNVGNGKGQILNSVFTCEEPAEMLKPMAQGLMNRYDAAGESPPKVMYVMWTEDVVGYMAPHLLRAFLTDGLIQVW